MSGNHRDGIHPDSHDVMMTYGDWTVPTTRYTLLYLWLSIQLQSSLIIFNIHLGSLGTGKSSTCKYLQDVFPTEDVDETTGHVYRRELKILLPSLQSGGGSGARLRAGSALATAAVGSWDIHQSWFKSDRGWHCQDTWPDGAGMGLGSENHFWSTGNNFGVQKISKGQVFRQVRHYLLSLAHWKLAPKYILLTSILTSHSWWRVNFIFWQIAARLCTSRVSLDSLEMQIGSLYASQ